MHGGENGHNFGPDEWMSLAIDLPTDLLAASLLRVLECTDL